MSLHDRATSLIRSLELSAQLMRKLEQGLRARRFAWVGIRPKEIEGPVLDLDRVAEDLRAEEQRRVEMLDGIAGDLPLPKPILGSDPQITVRNISSHLPPALAQRLVGAAAEARAIAKTVRVETALGTRLLDFSQRALEGFVLGATSPRDGPVSYDRHARRVRVPAGTTGAGSLVDGRL